MASAEEVSVSTSSESYSSKELDAGNIEIRRMKHRFRHWHWSGIFPLYGGWIPDPHIMATPVFEFSDEIKARLGGEPARYQGFDINFAFEDDSSEIVLAIEVAGSVFQYRLSVRDLQGVKDGFVNGDEIYAFLHEESLVFLTTLYISHPVFIEIGLPLSQGGSPVIHVRASPEWGQLGAFLRQSCREKQMEAELCSRFEVYNNRNSRVYVP